MIQLLQPDEVKKGPSKATEEARARVRDLGTEESKLIQSVNMLHGIEAEERARVDASVAKMRKEEADERGNLERQVAPLRAERIELMKPIDVLLKEAEERNATSKSREDAVKSREDAVADAEESITDRFEKIADREQEQDEREETLRECEMIARATEARLKTSTESLNEKWGIYNAAVLEKNIELTTREEKVIGEARANEIRTTELDKRRETLSKDYQSKDREIADRYQTLTAASKEITERELAVKEKEAAADISK